MANSYCEAVSTMEKNNVHVHYHDHEYGFPIHNDNELFARLVLEINQAGLSWTTILKKKENFFSAFHQFEIKKVANYKKKDFDRLMKNEGIIRNRLKIEAAIHNANVIIGLQKEFGSFKNWIDHHHPLTKDEWVKVFKKKFRFTGGEIVNEFLMSTGYLPGAHIPSCAIYKKVLAKKPVWHFLSGQRPDSTREKPAWHSLSGQRPDSTREKPAWHSLSGQRPDSTRNKMPGHKT